MSAIDWFIELQRESNRKDDFKKLQEFAHDNALRFAQCEHLRPPKKLYLDESRPLIGSFFDYATESTEPRYECNVPDIINSRSYETGYANGIQCGIDIDQE